MPDLLLEIGTEEMPPLEVPRLASQLLEGAQRTLAQAHLPYRKVEVLYALRRLALLVRDLAPDQEESYEVVKGPQAAVAFDRSGRPTQAAVGFAKSQGVMVDAITQAAEGGRSYAVIRRSVPGRRTIEILPEILPALVKQLHPSKSMRWDSSGLTFIRPIRWLVCLYGDEVIPVTLGTLRASRVSRGHRFLNPVEITLASASEYETALAGALVIVDAKAREETVMEGLKEAARELGGEILIDAELLGWIANGVEHPTPVLGRVPPAFLDLPMEVVQATLREGKFVPFVLPDGTSPYFMGFRDGLPDEKGIVRAGFERAVSARLRDSRFFFDKDRGRSLAECVRQLRDVIDDVRLGSLWEKMERIRALSGEIAVAVGKCPLDLVDRAAFLCKADLVTELVGAFPKLEGVAGAIYARLDGEPEEVASAIREHYRPTTFEGRLPETEIGTVISLADKLDTVVAALLVGEEPTASRDPYGIKRQANSLIRLAVEREIDLDFVALVERLSEIYSPVEKKTGMASVERFLTERVRQVLKRRYQIPGEVIVAVSAAGLGNFYCVLQRARVLDEWRSRAEFQGLAVAFARVHNITKSVETTRFDPGRFEEEAERTLWREYLKAEGRLTQVLKEGNYAEAIEHLLPLTRPIDRYFADVLVMTKNGEIKRNRLGFLRALTELFLRIGDFGAIGVEESPS